MEKQRIKIFGRPGYIRRTIERWAREQQFHKLRWAADFYNYRIRIEVAYYLGQYPHVEAVPILKTLLEDGAMDVKWEAAEAFEQYHLPIELEHTVQMIKMRLGEKYRKRSAARIADREQYSREGKMPHLEKLKQQLKEGKRWP